MLSLATIQFVAIWSQQIFGHATTAVLSWHVQKFVVIAIDDFDRKEIMFLLVWVMEE